MVVSLKRKNNYQSEFNKHSGCYLKSSSNYKKYENLSNLSVNPYQQNENTNNTLSRNYNNSNNNNTKVKYLGVFRADPNEYIKQYGGSLVKSDELPDYVKNIPTPPGIKLAADEKVNRQNEIEDDILHAFKTKTYDIADSKRTSQTSTADKINIDKLNLTKAQIDYIIELMTTQIYLDLSHMNKIKDYTIY